MTDGHKFSAVRRLSRRLLEGSKKTILPTTSAFGAPLKVILSDFHRRDLLRRKTMETLGYR